MRTKFLIIVCLQVLLLLGIMVYRQYWIMTGDKVVLKTVPVDPRDIFRGDYVNLSYEISSLTVDSASQKPEFQPNQPIFIDLGMNGDGTSYASAVGRERPSSGRFIQGKVRYERVESTWDVKLREDGGSLRELRPRWLTGLKKGDSITVCPGSQDSVFTFYKDDAAYKTPCGQNVSPVHGVVEDVTETKTRKVNVEYGIESYFVEEGKGIEIEQGRNVRGPIKVEVALRSDGKAIISRLVLEGK